jgi:hypothetical protein
VPSFVVQFGAVSLPLLAVTAASFPVVAASAVVAVAALVVAAVTAARVAGAADALHRGALDTSVPLPGTDLEVTVRVGPASDRH